jgi:hypothetical protein
MHARKRFVIACALGLLAGSAQSPAQNGAAEKAREGDIEHWIDYYKAGQRGSAAQPAPADAPVTRRKSSEPVRESSSAAQCK